MKKQNYKLKEEVWLWGHDAYAPWHFVSIPTEESARISKDFGSLQKGWRSLPVSVTVGKTTWKTSVFFDKRFQSYLLPIKASIRKKEGIFAGEKVSFIIKICPDC